MQEITLLETELPEENPETPLTAEQAKVKLEAYQMLFQFVDTQIRMNLAYLPRMNSVEHA